ncbi:MAG: macrolide 2'-phosphotransferase [Hyphomicrobiaceae bacterium]
MALADRDADARAVADLAASKGLVVEVDTIQFNETGLDFRVGFASAADGRRWVLRLPRRRDAMEKARAEARALRLMRSRLPVEVPDWQIFDGDLIAYPMLCGNPGLTFDPETYEVTWNFDKNSPLFPETLGAAVAALHGIETDAAREAGLPMFSAREVREKWSSDLDQVRGRYQVQPALWAAWESWIADDSYWPDHTVPIHGDLYAGHVMVDEAGRATGIIDWTEARVGDPAVDLVGHLRVFGEEALPSLIESYCAAGGRRWPRLEAHCRKLNSAHAVNYALYALAIGDAGHKAAAQALLMPENPPA